MPRGRGTYKTAFKDYTGRQFNHWTVLSRADDRNGRTHWNCHCVCGTEKVVAGIHLSQSASKSCGCARPTGSNSPVYKHGQSGTKLHDIWMAMHRRCRPDGPDHLLYFDKGIHVCERWHDFTNFQTDMGDRPSPRHSLGRIDGSKGYEPGNVWWETAKEQANNTTRNVFVTYGGETLTISQWADRLGMAYSKLKYRLYENWPLDKALTP